MVSICQNVISPISLFRGGYMRQCFALSVFTGCLALAFIGCGDKGTNPLPGTPTLVTPPDSVTGTILTPNLIWKKATNATSYELQVATTGDFTGTLTLDTTLVDTIKTTAKLANATRYFWRVKGIDADGGSAYSLVRSFTTASVGLDVWKIYSDTATTAEFINGVYLSILDDTTGTFQTPPSEVKFGTNTLDFVADTNGLAGFVFQAMGADTATGVDISAYTKLHFWIKTTAPNVSVSLGSLGDTAYLPLTSAYGFAADSAWHEITIPLASWTGVDLTKVNRYAGLIAASAVKGEYILLDDVWYAR